MKKNMFFNTFFFIYKIIFFIKKNILKFIKLLKIFF